MLKLFFILCLSVVCQADIIDEIKDRGFLRCGIHEALNGFSTINTDGKRDGFDIDFCRAISSALFGNSEQVKFIPVNAKTRFLALSSGAVDVIARNTTFSFERDTGLGIAFSAINFYDGQAFLVPKKYKITQLSDLDGATICVIPGTTTELNLADHFSSLGIKYKPVVVEGVHQAIKAYEQERCDAFTSDYSALIINRDLLINKDKHEVLADIISKEPLGLFVAANQERFRKLVAWVVFGTIQGEELGVSQQNIDSKLDSTNPKILRFLGISPLEGADNIGLKPTFMQDVIRQVGNYQDIFDRHLKPIGVVRGLNKIWTEGGLLYSPPFR